MAARRRSSGVAAAKLPTSVWSQLGPIPVVLVKDLASDGKPCMGVYDPQTRVIQIREGMDPVAALQVVGHEWVHALLSDAGVHLAETDEERVCDAVGSGIAGDILSHRTKA